MTAARHPVSPPPAPRSLPSPSAAVASAFDRIAADGRPGIWIEILDRAVVDASAAEVESRIAAGATLPLAGRTFAVKNNVDVAGIRTTAGCRSFGRVAARHAPVVQALVDAGAVIVGVTNLDQFATGLVGTRSPHGICPNARWPGRISGGSSSGSAVAVASGHVDFAIGTDTAGSGRVPAAANGILGWKPTKSWVSTEGVVPACESLDCVSFFGRDVEVLAEVRAAVAPGRSGPPDRPAGAPARLGVAERGALTFDGDEAWGESCQNAVDSLLRATGAAVVPVDIEPFLATGRLLYEGAFVRERFDAVGSFIEAHVADVDPVVYSIIHAAGTMHPDDLARDRAQVERRRQALEPLWEVVDAIVLPSVPRVPTVEEVLAAPIAVNSMLGTYTNFVNLLGLCAVTLPVGTADHGPPASLTLIAPPGRDDGLLALAATVAAGA